MTTLSVIVELAVWALTCSLLFVGLWLDGRSGDE